ncbi:chymotrypsin-1 [Musca vetustissima]|uniref:chymotrypsin-1 n=1 Tax=Musca vetustissima TaxID=27455 RepID=UPI002AB6D8D3|nr:chymotrypsin-1 [Musca vetustissima]
MAGKRFISCALFAVLFAVASASPSSRIWGGSDAATNQHPHVVSVRVKDAHVCTGSLIANNAVLTAASCVTKVATEPIDSNDCSVRVGSINQYAGGKIVGCNSIVIHPSSGNFLHNLAVVFLKESLEFTEKINKIELAAADEVYEEGTPVTVTGWGLDQSNASPYKLQQVSMSVLSAAECELQAGYGYDSIVCLQHPAGTGICRGDEGAGVVSGKQLISVASFAFGGCATKYPDISTKVSVYREWIDSLLA